MLVRHSFVRMSRSGRFTREGQAAEFRAVRWLKNRFVVFALEMTWSVLVLSCTHQCRWLYVRDERLGFTRNFLRNVIRNHYVAILQ